jgi:hypothetical protein
MSHADAKALPASDSVAKVAHGENLLRYWLRPTKRLGVDAGACTLNTVTQQLLRMERHACVRSFAGLVPGAHYRVLRRGLCCLQPTCSRHLTPRRYNRSCERSSQTSLQQRSPSLHPLRCAFTVMSPGVSKCMACARPLARLVVVNCCAPLLWHDHVPSIAVLRTSLLMVVCSFGSRMTKQCRR